MRCLPYGYALNVCTEFWGARSRPCPQRNEEKTFEG